VPFSPLPLCPFAALPQTDQSASLLMTELVLECVGAAHHVLSVHAWVTGKQGPTGKRTLAGCSPDFRAVDCPIAAPSLPATLTFAVFLVGSHHA
jgi:hypothetical protein